MTTQPAALRLADALIERHGVESFEGDAAAELRRLHVENAALAAALASSCDEQRHELWESGGIAGCERARVAERQRDALLEANGMRCGEESLSRLILETNAAAIRARTP